MSAKQVAYQVIETLKEIGVRHVFGVPSGGWVDYLEAIRTTDEMDFVLTTHEGGAGFMADVCGRLTGVPGVCFGTVGPGATNLSTGVGSAFLDRSPMIALTDEVAPALRNRVVQMHVDHQAIFEPITKKTTRLETDRVKEILFDAADVVMSGRPGPVHVGLPWGMSGETTAEENVARQEVRPVVPADADVILKMQELFAAAERPVLALGLRSTQATVRCQVLAIAEKLSIPIVLTPMAKGTIPEGHPCYAGVLFHALSDVVGETHQRADLIVAVGYDPVEFNYEDWIPRAAPVVNIDILPIDLDRSVYKLGVDVVGDIASSVNALAETVTAGKGWDLAALAERREGMFKRMSPDADAFGPCAALDVLRDVLPTDGIMTCDVGAHTHLVGQKWPTPEPGLQIMTNGWSSMGFGIPSAIAAKLCKPERSVCAVVGDGGFLMTVGELAVVVREKLKIVFVVLTDNDLALTRIKQERKNNPVFGTPVREAGTVGGESLFGVPVSKALTPEEFRGRLETAFAGDGPAVVEAIVDSREYDGLVLRKHRP